MNDISPVTRKAGAPEPPLVTNQFQTDISWETIPAGAGDAVVIEEVTEPVVLQGEGNVTRRARQLYAEEGMRHKSRLFAGFLAIVLGMFGVHKFYLGYNQAGFIMMAATIIGGLLTFGIASAVIGVFALIEACLYFSKSQETFERIYITNQRDWL